MASPRTDPGAAGLQAAPSDQMGAAASRRGSPAWRIVPVPDARIWFDSLAIGGPSAGAGGRPARPLRRPHRTGGTGLGDGPRHPRARVAGGTQAASGAGGLARLRMALSLAALS